jgi:hypothetical protein
MMIKRRRSEGEEGEPVEGNPPAKRRGKRVCLEEIIQLFEGEDSLIAGIAVVR